MCDICNEKHNWAICFQSENDSMVTIDKSTVSIYHSDNSYINGVQNKNTHYNIYFYICSVIIKGKKQKKKLS